MFFASIYRTNPWTNFHGKKLTYEFCTCCRNWYNFPKTKWLKDIEDIKENVDNKKTFSLTENKKQYSKR